MAMESSEIINKFLAEKEIEGWPETRLQRSRSRLAIFAVDFPNIEGVTKDELVEWEKILKERKLSERTIQEYMTVTAQFLDFAGYGDLVRSRRKSLDLRDRQFGNLHVLEPCKDKRSKERSVLWKCQCSCGKVVEIPANELTKGLHTSCGCKKAERLREINQYVDGTSLKMIFSDTIRKDNSSGYKGVYWKDDRWAVRIQYKGQRHYLGAFDKLEDAVKARRNAEERVREEAKALKV